MSESTSAAAAPPPEEFNHKYIYGLLDECRDQIEYGIEEEDIKPNSKIKSLIRELLELTNPPPPPPPPKPKAATPQKKKEALKESKLTAECIICGQPDIQGQFCRRGFKCLECRGKAGGEEDLVVAADAFLDSGDQPSGGARTRQKPAPGSLPLLVPSALNQESFAYLPHPKHYDDGHFYLDPFTTVEYAGAGDSHENNGGGRISPRARSPAPTSIMAADVSVTSNTFGAGGGNTPLGGTHGRLSMKQLADMTSTSSSENAQTTATSGSSLGLPFIDPIQSFRRLLSMTEMERDAREDPSLLEDDGGDSLMQVHHYRLRQEEEHPGINSGGSSGFSHPAALRPMSNPMVVSASFSDPASPLLSREGPESKYTVVQVPFTPESLEAVPKIRRMYNPNLAYNYAVVSDRKREKILFIQENMPTIVEQLKAHFPMPPQFLLDHGGAKQTGDSPERVAEVGHGLLALQEPPSGGFSKVLPPAVSEEGDGSTNGPTPNVSSQRLLGGAGVGNNNTKSMPSFLNADSAIPHTMSRGVSMSSLRSLGTPIGGNNATVPTSSSHLDLMGMDSPQTPGGGIGGGGSGAGGSASYLEGLGERMTSTYAHGANHLGPITCNTFVEYELLKKLIVTVLHGLKFLHEKGFVHGDVRPHNILFDRNHKVKLRYALFSQHPLDPPFLAPEAEQYWVQKKELQYLLDTDLSTREASDVFGAAGMEMTTSLPAITSKSFATPAWDIYALGVSLQFIAYGGVGCMPAPEVRNYEDDRLMTFIDSLTEPDPSKRLSVTGALDSPYLASVRLLNGVPVETVIAHWIREEDVPPGSFSTPRTPTPGAEGGTVTPTRQRSRRGSVSASTPGGVTGSAPVLKIAEKQDLESSFVREEDKKKNGLLHLDTFLKEHGPDFQLVRPHPYSITLYSVKSDPRRKRAAAETASQGASASQSGTPKAQRKRSITLPPHLGPKTRPSRRGPSQVQIKEPPAAQTQSGSSTTQFN